MANDAAVSLARKLEEFGGSLDAGEQQALAHVMRLYAEAVEDRMAGVATLSADDDKELEPVRKALADRRFDDAQQPLTTPCITVTTTTTTTQTSRWFCTPRK
jgi:hypothetical protein